MSGLAPLERLEVDSRRASDSRYCRLVIHSEAPIPHVDRDLNPHAR
jgi:hypothetical protein